MKKKLGILNVRVVAVSCEVLLAFPHRVEITDSRNQTFTNFSPRYSINGIETKWQLIININSKSTRRETVELENT